jgi:hypothetical protein
VLFFVVISIRFGDAAAKRAVPICLAMLTPSNAEYRVEVTETLQKLSHDPDAETSMSAIFSLGIIGAGTNNSRIADSLRHLAVYYEKEQSHVREHAFPSLSFFLSLSLTHSQLVHLNSLEFIFGLESCSLFNFPLCSVVCCSTGPRIVAHGQRFIVSVTLPLGSRVDASLGACWFVDCWLMLPRFQEQ